MFDLRATYAHAPVASRRSVRYWAVAAILFASMTQVASAADVAQTPDQFAAIDIYLADDFTDRGCASLPVTSQYQPITGYNASMAAQLDSYLTDDFSAPVSIAGPLLKSSYQPLAGYAGTPQRQ